MKPLIIIAALALVAGCAKRPDAITPAAIPNNAYAALSCERLAGEHQTKTKALSEASKKQHDAATGDAVGVFLIGVPLGSVTGNDREGVIAQLKGELIAIDAAKRNKGC